jgi:hypothetical protein
LNIDLASVMQASRLPAGAPCAQYALAGVISHSRLVVASGTLANVDTGRRRRRVVDPSHYGFGDDPPGLPRPHVRGIDPQVRPSLSIGRSRNARTRSSISVHTRET